VTSLLIGIIVALVALVATLVVGALWLARTALEHADKAADARERAATRAGDVELDARKVAEANASVANAAAAEKTAETRAGALEKELADDANRPPAPTDLAGAADRLRVDKPGGA
jgi:hypothetical protein